MHRLIETGPMFGNLVPATSPVLVEAGWPTFRGHFARLGAISGLFRTPILILSVAQPPKRWTEKVW
ncbi:MAG: hypothetical protein HLUCCA08_09935 [Rhodobacteraceae bacterium HLUCCA08]|nr:MAG: hypothetical protein HLUCCA08_09935 [Rhodobacteraceae bacterium HLUCCA08]